MKFEKADYNRVWPFSSIRNDNTLGYKVLINGCVFRSHSCSGKVIYKSKSAAMCAVNSALSWKVKGIVKDKLRALGMSDKEIEKDADYIGAWKNFVEQAKKDGFIQLVEIK